MSMDNKEATLKALDEGKELTSTVTGIKYKLINGLLHSKNSESNEWKTSELIFMNPPSWLNLYE